ncbi:hypothetical protein KI387_029364 [Taxus chinensis]|uniref:Protein arginine N-methyltransferase 2 n=1 Tax=Taxus chinensis TaxID=29808 RepID=A0AA38CHY2_TAXCH|nr:hypothetical protein KI387_029364 [Taxus chinensis]
MEVKEANKEEENEAKMQQEEKEASIRQEEELCQAAREGDYSKVKELIDSGADVTYFDENGFTPLMHAAKHGHSEVVERLLNAGAPWNALHPSGSSAGDFAMEAAHQDAFDLLLNAGVQTELVLGRIAFHEKSNSSAGYLEQRVLYSEDRLMDEEDKGVMMAWEKPLMEAHARAVCSGGEGGSILNVGFGMGLVDMAMQQYKPASHTIVEAHPDVYARMQATGWGDKPNVKIIFGRWQDVIPQLESYDGNAPAPTYPAGNVSEMETGMKRPRKTTFRSWWKNSNVCGLMHGFLSSFSGAIVGTAILCGYFLRFF